MAFSWKYYIVNPQIENTQVKLHKWGTTKLLSAHFGHKYLPFGKYIGMWTSIKFIDRLSLSIIAKFKVSVKHVIFHFIVFVL